MLTFGEVAMCFLQGIAIVLGIVGVFLLAGFLVTGLIILFP